MTKHIMDEQVGVQGGAAAAPEPAQPTEGAAGQPNTVSQTAEPVKSEGETLKSEGAPQPAKPATPAAQEVRAERAPEPAKVLKRSAEQPHAQGASEAPQAAKRTAERPKQAGAHSVGKTPKLRIVHKVPGRIRLKVPKGKSRPEFLDVYKEIFSQIPGIASVHTRPESGSVILHYDVRNEAQVAAQMGWPHSLPGSEIQDLADRIGAEANFLAERSEFAKMTVDFFKSADYQLKSATGNVLDLKIVLVGGLAVVTFLELGAGAATPMWVTLGLFALNHLADLHHSQHSPAPAVAAR